MPRSDRRGEKPTARAPARSGSPTGGRSASPAGGRSPSPSGGRSPSPSGGRSASPSGGRSASPSGGKRAASASPPPAPKKVPPPAPKKPVAVCGDGKVQQGEECDLGPGNKVEGSGCAPDCTKIEPFCGNGIKEAGEQCDRGRSNGMPGERCTSECELSKDCGCICLNHAAGGTKESAPLSDAAIKDLGMLKASVSMHSQGKASRCGDGRLDQGEQCDLGDANNVPGSGCAPDCTVIQSFCGNGIVEAGEQCDRGRSNGMPGENCTSECRITRDCGCLCAPGVESSTPPPAPPPPPATRTWSGKVAAAKGVQKAVPAPKAKVAKPAPPPEKVLPDANEVVNSSFFRGLSGADELEGQTLEEYLGADLDEAQLATESAFAEEGHEAEAAFDGEEDPAAFDGWL